VKVNFKNRFTFSLAGNSNFLKDVFMTMAYIVATLTLGLGLSSLAYAKHREGEGEHHAGNHHDWQDNDTNKDGKFDQAERDAMKAKWNTAQTTNNF
jgi:hypothetical protein